MTNALSIEKTELLISEIEKYPGLYDTEHAKYHNRTDQDADWACVAEVINI